MSVSVKEVRYIAHLAKLKVPQEHENHVAEKLSTVLEYMSKLDEVNSYYEESPTSVTFLKNVLREDVKNQRIYAHDALSCSRDADHDYFHFPKVING